MKKISAVFAVYFPLYKWWIMSVSEPVRAGDVKKKMRATYYSRKLWQAEEIGLEVFQAL